MDVEGLVRHAVEPASTARLRALVAAARARFTPSQRAATAWRESSLPFERNAYAELRATVDDPRALRERLVAAARRRRVAIEPHLADLVPWLLQHAPVKPSVASALLARLAPDAEIASQLVQLTRERAGLPNLVTKVEAGPAEESIHAAMFSFADRAVADGCHWIQHVAVALDPATRPSLSALRAAADQERRSAARVAVDDMLSFLRRAAEFVVLLSVRGLDPLGFPISRDVAVDVAPALERRLDLASWAQQAGHRLNLEGALIEMSMAVEAPWPLRLELIAGELGDGSVGGMGILLRLATTQPVSMPGRSPVLLCFPGEPGEERGPRFERWLAVAYAQAASAWRPWC